MDTAMLRAFLADIRANPLDDTPRLILADWLEDHALTEAERARGRFLRLCTGGDGDLSPEAAALREEHNAAWLGSLPECKGVMADCTSGLVLLVGEVGYFLSTEIAAFAASPAGDWVIGLCLTGGYSVFQLLLARPWLGNISCLGFASSVGFLPHGFQPFVASPNLGGLRCLDLSRQSLLLTHLKTLAGWPGLGNLHSLILTGNLLGSSGMEAPAGAASLAELHVLDLADCKIGGLGLQALAWRGCFAHLRKLDLSANDLPGQDLDFLHRSSLIPTLERLYLGDNDLGNLGVRVLAGIELPALRKLSLRSCNLSAEAIEFLAAAPWLRQLRYLDLEDNALRDEDIQRLREVCGPNLGIDI
jgi:uncharacterized protein (TIGR02996 family)